MSSGVKKEIILLQVLSTFAPVVVCGEACIRILYTEDEMNDHKAKALKYLKKTGKSLKNKDVVATLKVTVGFPPEEIIKTAEEVNANMIALSSHGLSGFSGWAFGGVADKVIRRGGRIPITLVRVPDYRKLPLGRPVDE
jgi:nucleotide-binding universal stress UspA family protein